MAESGKTDGKSVRVRLEYPHDRFEHGIRGVEAITRDGVHVAEGDLDKLRKLAEKHGLRLIEGDG